MAHAFGVQRFRTVCSRQLGARVSWPFGREVLAYTIGGRMFALSIVDRAPFQFNLKCDPELGDMLRRQYPRTVLPGYHMNKRHWVTVVPEGSELSVRQLAEFIGHSYERVVAGLPRRTPFPRSRSAPCGRLGSRRTIR